MRRPTDREEPVSVDSPSRLTILSAALAVASVIGLAAVGIVAVTNHQDSEASANIEPATASSSCPADPASNQIELLTQPHSPNFVRACFHATAGKPLNLVFRNSITPTDGNGAVALRLIVLRAGDYASMASPDENGVSYFTSDHALFVAPDEVSATTPPGKYAIDALAPGDYVITVLPQLTAMSAALTVT